MNNVENLSRTILLTDEDDSGHGYVISKSIDSPMIYATFWGRDTGTKNIYPLCGRQVSVRDKHRFYTVWTDRFQPLASCEIYHVTGIHSFL